MAEAGKDNNSGVTHVKPTSQSLGIYGSATLAEGENVNLEFEKSTVNVVDRDQIYINQLVYNITSVEEETPSGIQENALALVKCINDNAFQKTSDRILEDIGAEDLSKPDFQVHPQMRRMTRSEYFKGDYEEVHDMEVKIKRKFFFWQKKEVVKNQFRKEFGFLRQKVDDKRFVDLDEVLQQVINGKSSITAIVASAGSGKTTLMRRIARKTLGHSLTNTEAIASPSQLKLKLIHYIEIKGMPDKGFRKPSKFLFGGLFQNEIDEEHAYKWLLEHQSESVLFFDGLDQAAWEINREGEKNINPHTSAEAATIMYNILSRNLLADTKIVISSREFQLSDLPADARPADIITLSGLTLDDAKKLFVFLIRPHGNEAWEKIEKMSPRLINLVSIPVFLVLAAVIIAKNPNEAPPKTITGLYKKIISILSSVKNIRRADAIAGVINKLKAMAYRGMKEGRATFSENDLKRFRLSKEDVRDLMMKVPGNNLLSCNLLDGSFLFFFCHQSLQEFLAAGFIVEMTPLKFMSFNSKHLHKTRWSVVRRFVCGIMYDEMPHNLHEVPNRSRKRRLLAGSIRSQLMENGDNKHIRMELYTAIYESGDDDLVRQISDINASKISLSRDEAHIVGSLAARSESLKCLDLSDCNINDELLVIITECLERKTQVTKVKLRNNNFSATALRSLLGHRRIESLSGNVDWEVVELRVRGWDVELKNEENVIKISGNSVEGLFNIKDSNLSFNQVRAEEAVEFLEILFGVEVIEFKEQEQMLAEQDDWQKIPKRESEKWRSPTQKTKLKSDSQQGHSVSGASQRQPTVAKNDYQVVEQPTSRSSLDEQDDFTSESATGGEKADDLPSSDINKDTAAINALSSLKLDQNDTPFNTIKDHTKLLRPTFLTDISESSLLPRTRSVALAHEGNPDSKKSEPTTEPSGSINTYESSLLKDSGEGIMSSSQMTSTSSINDRQQPDGAEGPRNKEHGPSFTSKYMGPKQSLCIPSTQTWEIGNCTDGGSTESDATKEVPATREQSVNPHHRIAGTISRDFGLPVGAVLQTTDDNKSPGPSTSSNTGESSSMLQNQDVTSTSNSRSDDSSNNVVEGVVSDAAVEEPTTAERPRRKLQPEQRLLIKTQIFHEHKLQRIHCILWNNDITFEEYPRPDYKQQFPKPIKLLVNKEDGYLVMWLFKTRAGDSYCTTRQKKEVNLMYFDPPGDWSTVFRIDSVPDDGTMDFDCILKTSAEISEEEECFNQMRFQIRTASGETEEVILFKIKKYIFFKKDSSQFHCYFSTKDEDEDHEEWSARGYDNAAAKPKIIHATVRDNIHVSFSKSNPDDSYQILNYEEKLNTDKLISDKFIEYIFRIDPGLHEIKEEYIAFDCHVRKNGKLIPRSIPLQFKIKRGNCDGNVTSEQTSETASSKEISPAVVKIILHTVHSAIGTLVEKGGKFEQHGEKNKTFIGASQQDIKKNNQVADSESE